MNPKFEKFEVEEGTITTSDGAGNILSETHYKNKKKHGRSIFLKPDGDTLRVEMYDDGKLISSKDYQAGGGV